MTKADYGKPALMGGVVMGLLSALPLVSYGNGCCCLWVWTGGLVAAYFLQQNKATPISPGDGALVGLLAGLIGAGIQLVLSIPLDMLVGPMERQMLLRFIENMPPDMRGMFEQAGRTADSGTFFVVVVLRLIGFLVFLIIGAIFSTLGGLLGAAIFAKSSPPGTLDAPTA